MNGRTRGLPIWVFGTVLVTTLLVGAVSDAGAWATITVNSLADPGKPGICSLRDAITAANTQTETNGCVGGKGHDTIQFSVTGTITLTETLPQIADSNLTVNGPASPGITIDGDNAVQVMQVASGATLSLSNLTITHGSAESNAAGGIVNQGTLAVSKCTLSENSAGPLGSEGLVGGILNQGALTIINSTFSDNNGGAFGAGGIVNHGTLTVANSTFSGNTMGYNGPGTGGIDNSGTLTVSESTFSNNQGGGDGAIGNSGTLSVYNSTFSGNGADANEGAGYGGGIGNESVFVFNPRQAVATVIDSTFSDNSARSFGNGILNGMGSTLSVINSTFESNSGSNITNFGVASLKGTIVTGNAPSNNCGPAYFGMLPVTDLGYNISSDDTCGLTAVGSLNNTDPMLDPVGPRQQRRTDTHHRSGFSKSRD
jgi:CSLREA domain-containing protein